jgi:hypothetical protein
MKILMIEEWEVERWDWWRWMSVMAAMIASGDSRTHGLHGGG